LDLFLSESPQNGHRQFASVSFFHAKRSSELEMYPMYFLSTKLIVNAQKCLG
jgi:hypothetical protein